MRRRLLLLLAPLLLLAASPAHAISAGYLTDRWNGSYNCSQGETWLQLDIKYNAGDWVDARFTFGPYEANGARSAAIGSFHQSGKVIGDHLHLKGDYWYQSEPGWVVVDLDGDFSADGKTFSGRVSGADGCEDFSVSRR